MKKLGIFLAALALLVLCVTLIPTEVDAAEIVESGTCGTNVTWTLDDEGTLTISGTGWISSYTYNNPAPWYSFRESIKKVNISNGISSIGELTFYNCVNMNSVTIANSVTIINELAFYRCTRLVSVTLSDKLTKIGRSAFADCTALTSINIPDSVTKIDEYVFNGCTSLKNITVPKSVTSIGLGAFSACNNLTGIWVDSNNQYYTNDSNGILFNKTKTELVTMPGKYAGTYTIPDTVTSIAWRAFEYCTGLTGITIPASVTSIGYSTFTGCTGLRSVTYCGTEEQWGKISIGSDNTALTNATRSYHNWKEASCIAPKTCTICGATEGSLGKHSVVNEICTVCRRYGTCGDNLTWTLDDEGTLTISGTGEMENYGQRVNYSTIYAPWYSSSALIKKVVIKDGVTSIGEGAFCNCTSLTSVNIPNSVTRIGEYVFNGCTSLKNITVPKSVTSIGVGAFGHCKSLTSVIIPDSVTSIGKWAFLNCTSLTSITIPDSVTSIGVEAFCDCTSLTSINIPNSVTRIGEGAFGYCKSLTSVIIPDSVTSIGNLAFCSCSSLTGIWVDSNNQYYSNDSNGILFNKSKTELVTMPGKFSGTYTIPDGVTRIGEGAFRNCTSLTSINIPNSVTSIGDYAFYTCPALTSVTYCGTEELWNQIAIGANNINFINTERSYHNWKNGICTLCGIACEHTYVGGTCSVCGEAEVTGPILDENLTVPTKSILLGGYIGAQFEVNLDAITAGGYENVYVIVIANGVEYKYDASLLEDEYIFEHYLAPKEMGVSMQITAYAEKNGVTIYGNTETWSVKDGIMSRLKTFYPYIHRPEYEERCILLVDMLYYGAQAQIRFGEDSDGLVTDGLDAKYVALRTTAEPVITAVNTATQKTPNQLYQYNLGLDDAVNLQFTFYLENTNYDEYVVKVTYNGRTYQYTGDDLIPMGTSGITAKFVTAVFNRLEATDMRDTVTVELWRNGAKVSDTYTASIEGVATASIAEGKNVDILKAMITYGDSAKVSLG